MINLNTFLIPSSLFFLAITLGFLIGKIKIFSISFGIAGILFASIFLGLILCKYLPSIFNDEFNITFSQYSKLGSALFTSTIGLSSGMCITRTQIKKNLLYLLIGSIIVISGFLATKLIYFFDIDINHSILLGILCGSLTSSPALAVACEKPGIIPEFATIGYGTTYLLGVIGIVLFAELSLKNYAEMKNEEENLYSYNQNHLVSLFLIALVCIAGQFIGGLDLPLINSPIGSTGGTLICGILYGAITKKLSVNIRCLSIYRNFGLIMFFVGNGILAGKRLNTSLDIKWFIYGIIITSFCILSGNFISKILLKNNSLLKTSIISGGMTSSPAMSVIFKKDKSKESLSAYSFSYLGALITIIIAIRFI